MIGLGYSAGDKIYVFSRHGFYSGVVEKITNSGQVVVSRGDVKNRFNTRGYEIGSSSLYGNYIKYKKDQDAAADSARRDAVRIRRRNEFIAAIQEIRGIDVRRDECVSEAAAALRALADKLESDYRSRPMTAPSVARDGDAGVLDRMLTQAAQYRCDSGNFTESELIEQTAMDREAIADVAELLAADALLDKCDKAIKEHRLAPNYTESWTLLQHELRRTRDFAVKRREAALARCNGNGGVK